MQMLVHVYARGTLVCNLKMEKDLHSTLSLAGVVTDSLIVLEEERVTTLKVFKSLREEHFARLLPKMSVGQHALLVKTWEDICDDGFLVAGNFSKVRSSFYKTEVDDNNSIK